MYDEFLNFIFPLAKGAGEIQLAYFRGDDLGIETKSNAYDVVTRADKESEAYIVQAILGRYPGHGILGEEGGVMGTAGSDYRWVIDPLDGTTNYSQGLPIFSVSIALQHKGGNRRRGGLCTLPRGAILGVERRRGLHEEPFRRGEAAASLRQADPRHVGARHGLPLRQGCQSGQQQRQRRADRTLCARHTAAGIGGL